MPRRTRGPFLELQNLPALNANSSDIVIGLGDDAPPPDDLMERMDLLNTVLADAGCNCNGHHAGRQRDEYFGADIAELVLRSVPHETFKNGGEEPVIVAINLATLQVEVDENDELCVWIYEEQES